MTFKVRAKGRTTRRKPGEMNKLEAEYERALQARQSAGEVLWWSFEAVKLKLATNTFLTPDFAVMLADGAFEIHEVKGHWEDDARVKIKVAASMFPFQFVAIRKERGSWVEERF